MFGNAFGWPHLLIILAVLLLLFGAAKLPALAKSMGQSARAFKGEMSAMKEEDAARKAQHGSDSGTDDKGGDSTASGSGDSPSDPDRTS